MSRATTSTCLTALGIGIALAGAPGPVQAILQAEAVRGGVPRGLRALAGVHLTFGSLLIGLALGFSVASPHGVGLRILKLAGGVLLLWLAGDGLRARPHPGRRADQRRTLPPSARGVLAILLNPGGWLFLGAVASPLLAAATERGGTSSALLAAGALVAGAALGDIGLVMLGGIGLRWATEPALRLVRGTLAVVLAAFAVWLVISGAIP